MKQKSSKITAKTTLGKVLSKEGAQEVLAKNGVPCVLCPMAKFEMENLEIGQICKIYGLPLEKILKELKSLP